MQKESKSQTFNSAPAKKSDRRNKRQSSKGKRKSQKKQPSNILSQTDSLSVSLLIVVKTPTHTFRGSEKGTLRVKHKDGFLSIDKGPEGNTVWDLKNMKKSERPIMAKDDSKRILKIGSNSIEFQKITDYEKAVTNLYSYRKKRYSHI